MGEATATFFGSLALAGAHAFAPLVRLLPRRRLLQLASFSGGAGLAYVFLYLLFQLAKYGAPKIHALLPLGPEPLETLFILLLCALLANYLLQGRLEAGRNLEDDYVGLALSFLVYNFLAGAGLVEEAHFGGLHLTFYVTAIGLHMLFNDLFLAHHPAATHLWRWRAALAAMPVAGCALATLGMSSDGLQYAMLAVIAGGTVINVLRHELPSPRALRIVPFVAGALVYAALILATWRVR